MPTPRSRYGRESNPQPSTTTRSAGFRASSAEWAAAEATRRERWPGDAPVRLDLLAQAAFPTVVVAGGYDGHTRGGRDFAAVCGRLADGIGARLVVFEGSLHTPQIEEPEAFNRLLRELWRS